jgi:hypothetical protein
VKVTREKVHNMMLAGDRGQWGWGGSSGMWAQWVRRSAVVGMEKLVRCVVMEGHLGSEGFWLLGCEGHLREVKYVDRGQVPDFALSLAVQMLRGCDRRGALSLGV